MKIIPVLFVLMLSATAALANITKVDSLKQLLEHHATADKAEVLWSIAYELFDIDNAQALFYGERAYHEVWKRGDSLQIVKVGTTYGQLLRRMGKVDHSIEVSSLMLPIAKRHEYRKYWKMLLNSLGVAYVEKARFDLALGLNHQSLLLRQQDGDTMEIIGALNNLGFLYYRLDDFDRSQDYISRAIKLIELVKEKPDWVPSSSRFSYTNLGFLNLDQRRFRQAITYFRRAISIDAGTGNSEINATLNWGLASAFLELGRLDSVRHYVNKVIGVGMSGGNYYALARSYLVASRMSLLEGNWDEAEHYFQRAVKMDRDFSYPRLHKAVLFQKLKLSIFKGEPTESFTALSEYDRYSDSLEIINGRSRITSLEVSFAQKENESKLKSQTSIMALQKENLDR